MGRTLAKCNAFESPGGRKAVLRVAVRLMRNEALYTDRCSSKRDTSVSRALAGSWKPEAPCFEKNAEQGFCSFITCRLANAVCSRSHCRPGVNRLA